MVVTGESPYPLNDRNDLSLNTGGGKGVLISTSLGVDSFALYHIQ